MAIQDHVAIMLAGSLDRPAPNKKKPHAAPRFYVRAAFPPEAAGDLGAAMAQVAPGGNWQALSHNIKPNSRLAKPYAGIPNDWLIVKFDTQYSVPVYGEDGRNIPATVENSPLIRSQFYSGQKIRIEGTPYTWNNDGETGISWNLYGALAVGGGERRNTGGSDGFAAYRKDVPPVGAFGGNSPQTPTAPANVQNDPFGSSQPQQPAHSNADPFQQSNVNPNDPFGTNR